jgi:hypothetical protein
MAKSMTADTKAAPSGKASKGKARPAKGAKSEKRSFVWLQGLICGALITLAPSLAMLLAFLLAPGLIATVLDRSPGRTVSRGVFLFGLAASVSPAKTLWEGGLAMPLSVQLMTDPIIFGTAWAAAAAGWMVAEVAPIIVEIALTSARKLRAAKLEETRVKFSEEWGLQTEKPDTKA